MATEFESLTILLLQVLVLVSSLQVVIMMIVLYHLTKILDQVRSPAPVRDQPPKIRPLPVPEPAPASPPPVPRSPARPAGKSSSVVEILDDRRDIRGSLQAICEKFGLRDMIITTMDGLVVVSRSPEVAEEAARLTGIHLRGGKTGDRDLHFLPVTHRGDKLLVILWAGRTLDDAERLAIEKDVAQILNWWL
jgi:hypothetical protein